MTDKTDPPRDIKHDCLICAATYGTETGVPTGGTCTNCGWQAPTTESPRDTASSQGCAGNLAGVRSHIPASFPPDQWGSFEIYQHTMRPDNVARRYEGQIE